MQRIKSPKLVGIKNKVFNQVARKLHESLTIHFEIKSCEKLKAVANAEPVTEESFLITTVRAKTFNIAATSEKGLYYGLQTLVCKFLEDGVAKITLFQTPLFEDRGLKLYLPAPTKAGIKAFHDAVDFAANCKCSFIMIELGGAMEYRSHPEIGDGWREYTAFMREYPGKTLKVQNQYGWHKNSIHSENGGGDVVPQETIARLIDYCRQRYIEVIPEMPSLSHCDYLLTKHHEIAERAEDPLPDACCPLNEDYHKIYEDLLDEVIALFNPARINICHDELYSVALCPKCRGKKPPNLYADNINRINRYLKARGVRTQIYGEKMLDAHFLTGEPIGGAYRPSQDGKEPVSALFPCADMIDRDVEILHWYWGIDRRFDDVYVSRGFSYLFANFAPAIVCDWRRRIAQPGFRGVCTPNWGSTTMRTLQRNNVLFDLAYCEALAWDAPLGEHDYAIIRDKVLKKLFALRTTEFNGKKFVEVTHTCDVDREFQFFFDGYELDEKKYVIGEHVFYSTGLKKEIRFPITYGSNITGRKVSSVRHDPCDKSLTDSYGRDVRFTEIAYETLPETIDGETWCRCRFALPQGCGKLTYLRTVAKDGIKIEAQETMMSPIPLIGCKPRRSAR